MRFRSLFIKNVEAGELLEIFFVSAVSAVLAIRFYLFVTGYPFIGGEVLHIGHMLWGGALMLAAIIVLLAFLDRSARFVAACLGGLGFGTFIDELGKFITRDNDYFFQPTIALIYLIFVLLFLVVRYLSEEENISKTEASANALEVAKEGAVSNLDSLQKKAGMEFVGQSNLPKAVAHALHDYFEEYTTSLERKNVYARAKDFLHRWYLVLLHNKWFLRAVVLIVIVNAGAVFAQIVVRIPEIEAWVMRGEPFPLLSPLERMEFLFSLVSGVLVIWGTLHLRSSRLRAYQLFRYAILVSIFVTHFFIFFREELGAILGFAVTVLVLLVLDYMIKEERGLSRT